MLIWRWRGLSLLSDQVVAGGQPSADDPANLQAIPNPILLNLSVTAQNCNSMNVSALAKNTRTKVASIISLNSDIILLSDTRLGNKEKFISDMFRLKYRFFSNSTQAKRGVAILIRNDLDFTLNRIIKDTEENCIFLDGTVAGDNVAIGAVYGPNDDNVVLFNFLNTVLPDFKDHAIIIGGDWNTTVSSLPPEINPDIYNMRAIPSQTRSDWLNEVITRNKLTDPFRYLNPNLMDFSYNPYGNARKNRSRIDFFLVSENILGCAK